MVISTSTWLDFPFFTVSRVSETSKPLGHGLVSSGSNSTGVRLPTGPVFALQVTLSLCFGGIVVSCLLVWTKQSSSWLRFLIKFTNARCSDFICQISERICWLLSELGFLALCSPPSLGTSQAFTLALFWCSVANFVVCSSCCEASSLICFLSSSSVSPGVRRVVLRLDAEISSQRPVSKDFTIVYWISERPWLDSQSDSWLAKFTMLCRSKAWSRNCCGDSLLSWLMVASYWYTSDAAFSRKWTRRILSNFEKETSPKVST